MAIEYQRDLPANSPEENIAAEEEHVRLHIASLADADDNPDTHAADVRVWRAKHPDDPTMMRIEGYLDAEVDAPYLKDGFDPWAGVDPLLFALEIERAQADEEVLRGQA